MRKIVDGAPDRTASHHVGDTDTYFSEEFHTYFCHTLKDWETSDFHCASDLEMNYEVVIDLKNLRAAIADHDRTDYVDFKVGDKVVFEAHFCDEHKGSGYGEITYCTMDKRVFEIDNYYLVSIDEIRYATLDEIRAGHRIDANTDYVTDIRNHISPMTIVQGD